MRAQLTQRRAERLTAAEAALERLATLTRLVHHAYHLRLAWLDAQDEAADEAQDDWACRDITRRLACAGHYPLVIGDPDTRTLWLSRHPLTAYSARARSGPCPVELPPARAARLTDAAIPDEALAARMGAANAALVRAAGPAGRLLLLQADALLAVAARVASSPAASTSSPIGAPRDVLRYVLAAPLPPGGWRHTLRQRAPQNVPQIPFLLLANVSNLLLTLTLPAPFSEPSSEMFFAALAVPPTPEAAPARRSGRA